MFSKHILESDIANLKTLVAQRENCRKMIKGIMQFLFINDNLSDQIIKEEKITIGLLVDQLKDLEEQIYILENQMFLNYTNTFSYDFNNNRPGTLFPHINSIHI